MSEHPPETATDDATGQSPERLRVFDRPGNVKRTLAALYAVCGIAFGLEFVVGRHVLHPWEALFGFHAVYGFVACVTLVLVAKELRKFIMRPEEYYDGDGDA
jgi:hypothetical protein